MHARLEYRCESMQVRVNIRRGSITQLTVVVRVTSGQWSMKRAIYHVYQGRLRDLALGFGKENLDVLVTPFSRRYVTFRRKKGGADS
jgi:hypothetical protein